MDSQKSLKSYTYTTASSCGTYSATVCTGSSAGGGGAQMTPEEQMHHIDQILAELDKPDFCGDMQKVEVENLPAVIPDRRELLDINGLRHANEEARRLVGLVRHAPTCEGCVCFREVVDTTMGKYGRRVSQVRRMCAHPAYSEARTDFTRAKLDFIPVHSCEDSRAEGTVCGPTGRLFVSSEPSMLQSIGRDVWVFLSTTGRWIRRADISSILFWGFMSYLWVSLLVREIF